MYIKQFFNSLSLRNKNKDGFENIGYEKLFDVACNYNNENVFLTLKSKFLFFWERIERYEITFVDYYKVPSYSFPCRLELTNVVTGKIKSLSFNYFITHKVLDVKFFVSPNEGYEIPERLRYFYAHCYNGPKTFDDLLKISTCVTLPDEWVEKQNLFEIKVDVENFFPKEEGIFSAIKGTTKFFYFRDDKNFAIIFPFTVELPSRQQTFYWLKTNLWDGQILTYILGDSKEFLNNFLLKHVETTSKLLYKNCLDVDVLINAVRSYVMEKESKQNSYYDKSKISRNAFHN